MALLTLELCQLPRQIQVQAASHCVLRKQMEVVAALDIMQAHMQRLFSVLLRSSGALLVAATATTLTAQAQPDLRIEAQQNKQNRQQFVQNGCFPVPTLTPRLLGGMFCKHCLAYSVVQAVPQKHLGFRACIPTGQVAFRPATADEHKPRHPYAGHAERVHKNSTSHGETNKTNTENIHQCSTKPFRWPAEYISVHQPAMSPGPAIVLQIYESIHCSNISSSIQTLASVPNPSPNSVSMCMLQTSLRGHFREAPTLHVRDASNLSNYEHSTDDY